MDLSQDWEFTDQALATEAQGRNANLRVAVDRALRATRGKSSVGMVVMAYYPGGRKELLHRSGSILGELSSAFLAELSALELGLQKVAFFING